MLRAGSIPVLHGGLGTVCMRHEKYWLVKTNSNHPVNVTYGSSQSLRSNKLGSVRPNDHQSTIVLHVEWLCLKIGKPIPLGVSFIQSQWPYWGYLPSSSHSGATYFRHAAGGLELLPFLQDGNGSIIQLRQDVGQLRSVLKIPRCDVAMFIPSGYD